MDNKKHPDGRVLVIKASLRRHNPDQVLRVEGCRPSSQPGSRAPRLVVEQ
jgi:hypothetical protein